ncbi:histidinol-phosphate transaminase [Aquirufa antheringensis]|uniref:histidinol-phosphate transaminase n=1 Tax=Aquirufa antheringensis TaxID=2516559 RepID=UPI001032F7D6|nr:histidinol-phosphate transaminase [Aquirufa antheringensis]MCL9968487.1 histidinol-phosphate transaminase [Aquirufa antheringensis]MCZ2476742.1 histidinol-phosphate transaminase [Aquirufa antheringensis]TBH69955.1 histidinol-phosphate transaminase [Aquirufa antheringensis]
MNFENFILPHIWNLKPYSSARDEFKGKEGIFLDANENPLGSGVSENWNRYPDPLQLAIKDQLAAIKSCSTNQIFLGNGSDEAIDLLMRMTCQSGVHNIILCPPTYGMYEVSASINHIEQRKVSLSKNYQLDVEGILQTVDQNTRLLFLCSPNNPTGNKLKRSDIYTLIESFKTGFVVIDEAYIDFSDEPSFILELAKYPQVIVMQTLSKAYGLASLRLGMAFAHPTLIQLLNKIKPPYNIGGATQEIVFKALKNPSFKNDSVRLILAERTRLVDSLQNIPDIIQIYPSDANFILVHFKRATELFNYLIESQLITRNRSSVALCEDSIRITIGLSEENDKLVQLIKQFYSA